VQHKSYYARREKQVNPASVWIAIDDCVQPSHDENDSYGEQHIVTFCFVNPARAAAPSRDQAGYFTPI
jgi:hypothetical protein